MIVAMGCEGARAFFIAQSDAACVCDLADAMERDVGESRLPTIEHGDGVFGGNSEEEFVIFAISERGEERGFAGWIFFGGELGGAANGDGGGTQFRTDALTEQMPQVGGESIAEIDHGVDVKRLCEPPCFGQARLEGEMMFGQ